MASKRSFRTPLEKHAANSTTQREDRFGIIAVSMGPVRVRVRIK